MHVSSQPLRSRLFLQIYGSVVGAALLVLVGVALIGWHALRGERSIWRIERAAEELAARLDAEGRDAPELADQLRREARRLGVGATLWDAEGRWLGSSGGPRPPGVPVPTLGEARRGPLRVPGITVELASGRWLRVYPTRRRAGRPGPLLSLALLGAAIALGAYPVSRRIVRRLERLERGVEALGEGDLRVRVAVEGRDEVASLARSFNRAAERIESLVAARTRMLASASHELRTPLARLRVALELLAGEGRADLRAEAERDIAELDELIEDLLIASRIESGGPASLETVALHELARDEARRFGARVDATPCQLSGNPRELRRLLRNLLENARRHGGGQLELELAAQADGVRLQVLDRGPGVPESERERIFEPFYRPRGHSEARDGGVGLGLALVREIARHYGGDAICLPREGGGTRFEVTLRERTRPLG
jgi:signal transduction histidine kinase